MDPTLRNVNERLVAGEAVPQADVERALAADLERIGGTEVTVEQVVAATRAAVHELAPLITADPPVDVEVWDAWHREWYPGLVTHWRGTRVNVTYSRGPGMRHLVWLPADAVRRVQA